MLRDYLNRLYFEEAGKDGAAGGGGEAETETPAGQHPSTGTGSDDLPGGLLGSAARAAAGGNGEEGEGEGDKGKKEGETETSLLELSETELNSVPEQFRKDGKLNYAALLKSYKDTRTELKNAKGKPGKAPEKPEDYTFEMPELPDGKKLDIPEDDVGLNAAREAAHKHGIPQEDFQGFVSEYLTAIAPMLPEPAPDEASEKAKLGKNADAIITGVLNWGEKLHTDGILSDAEHDEIFYMGSTATGISALQKLRTHYTGEQGIPVDGDTVGDGLPSKEELYAAAASTKYQEDPAYRAKIDKQFDQVFGSNSSGTSPRGLGVRSSARRA
jgi:hypothetical protein